MGSRCFQTWVRENSSIGPTELQKKMKEKYGLEVPYIIVFYGKEMALDKIYGKWSDSFQLLYTFKAQVERASLGSVMQIDRYTM